MTKNWRRYEVTVPLQFNDGTEIPAEVRGEALQELFEYFGGVSYHTQPIEGHWLHEGTTIRTTM